MAAFETIIDAAELFDFAALLENVPEVAVPELHAAVVEGSLLLEREVKERTPVGIGGGGGLRGNIAAQPPAVLGNEVIGVVGTAMAYAVPVELGTRPHFPPIQPLRDWVRLKLGISDEEEIEDVAWRVARKIAIRGTEGAHMFEHAFNANQDRVQAIFAAAYERIMQQLGWRR